MSKDAPQPSVRADLFFWVLSAFVLGVLFLGLGLRVHPTFTERIGLPVTRSLIPPRYLDLVGLALFLLLIYAGLKRRQVGQLEFSLTTKASREKRINLELLELTSIFEVSSRVNGFLDVEEALQFIANAARECLSADRSSLFLVEDDRIVMRAASGSDLEPLQNVSMSMGSGVAGWVALNRQPLLLNSPTDLASFYPDSQPERNIASSLCVPLILKGETIGVLNVNRLAAEGKEHFQERHLKLLSIFADYAASTINNLQMYRQIASAHSRLEKSYSEMKQVQEQLIQAEKMSAIGQLISEVSHELNNPLTTAVGYAQLLTKANEDPEIAEYLEIIRDEGMRCQRIIQNLLDFARKNEGEASLVAVNRLIRKTVNLRKYQLSLGGVEVELDLQHALPTCLADPTLLQQVFLNLINNAEQAIAEERCPGVIRIHTQAVGGEDAVEIVISDTGPGIPEEIRERIFEPFCTTKPTGKGTGLGLSVCQGILTELRGEIHAENGPEGGARFTVRIPASSAPSRRTTAGGGGVKVARGLRILVVDDDPKVRKLLERTLVFDQHDVTTVESAAAALEQMDSEAFDLVLTDLRMPEMTGIELHEAIRERDEKAAERMVFFTGGTLSPEHEEFFEQSGAPLVRKPFRLEEVRREIRTALDRSAGGVAADVAEA